MKARDRREKTTEDLQQIRETLRKGLFNLRFRSATDRVENSAEFGRTRRDIARIETILTERRRTAAKPAAAAAKTS